MSIAMAAVAATLFGLLFVPWLLLLSSPALVATGSVASVAVEGAGKVRELLRARGAKTRTISGVLCVAGLEDTSQEARIRRSLGRVLELAGPGSSPKACTCVKATDDGFVGVVRVFDRRGHYLARISGPSAESVTNGVVRDLDRFRTSFPAEPGTRRQRIAECDPRSCPIRVLRQGLQPVAA